MVPILCPTIIRPTYMMCASGICLLTIHLTSCGQFFFFIKWPMSMIFKIHCMAHDVWSQRCVAGHKVEGEHVWSPLWFGSFYKHVFYSMIINIRYLELIYWCEVGMIKPLIYIGWLLNFGHCGIYILLLETYVSLGAKKWRTRQHITFDLISFFQLIFHYYK